MNQNPKDPHRPAPPAHPHPPVDDVNKLKQKAESEEVASRHKNSGPKDHKGAR